MTATYSGDIIQAVDEIEWLINDDEATESLLKEFDGKQRDLAVFCSRLHQLIEPLEEWTTEHWPAQETQTQERNAS